MSKLNITPNDLARKGYRIEDVVLSYRNSIPDRVRDAVLFALHNKSR